MIENTMCRASRPAMVRAGLCVREIVHQMCDGFPFCWLVPVRTAHPTDRMKFARALNSRMRPGGKVDD